MKFPRRKIFPRSFFQERKPPGAKPSRFRLMEQKRRKDDDDDDEDDEEEGGKKEAEEENADEHVSNLRERRFRDFASVEYRDEIFMVNSIDRFGIKGIIYSRHQWIFWNQ